MKILLLADPEANHTIKWANALSEKGFEILVFGLSTYNKKEYNKKIKIISYPIFGKLKYLTTSSFTKAIYLRALPKLKRIIKEFKPDILHAHYASSFGLLAAMTTFHPFIISAWGTDIFGFPRTSVIHKNLLKYSLSKADRILSTSHIMAEEIKKYSKNYVHITPFGIDTDIFKPAGNEPKNSITIGTVKTLEPTYGIDILLKTFAEVKKNIGDKIAINLMIVGEGSQKQELINLSRKLNIERWTSFVGHVPYSRINQIHQKMDVELFLSREESFGVSVLEASACGIPVITTNIGGFREIVEKDVTGYLVERDDYLSASEKLFKLILNEKLRVDMGKAGRQFVQKNYELSDCVEKVISIYRTI